MKNETAFEFPAWYLEFQTAVLKQLPRPGDIDQTTALGWERNQNALKKNLAEVLLPPVLLPSILDLVSTVVIPATTSKFIAKDKFVVNITRNAPVEISVVFENFTNWFLSGDGKIENPIKEQTLCYHKLRKSSVNNLIIAELGGETKAETTLSEMFYLMEKQKNGGRGILLTNGYANVFIIRDQNGVLRIVDVVWRLGWIIDATSVDVPRGYGLGYQVFSRNSDFLLS
jgi:hypothetical protein